MLLDVQTLEASSKMDSTIEEFIKANPMPPLDWANLEGTRGLMKAVGQMQAALLGPPNPEFVTEEDVEITLRDGFKSSLKVFKPTKAPSGGSPLIIFAFGGGFIGGDNSQSTPMGRMFAKAFGAVVVGISYRLAPEHKFPCSQLDGWDAAKWCAEHASELGADPTKGFIMSGVSAGGNIASAVVTHSLEEPLAHPFTGQWLAVPTILDVDHTPEKYRAHHLSIKHNADAPVLSASSIDSINKFIDVDRNSPWRFPILSKAPISKQPKAFIMADGMDPLRDDALLWDEILKDAGVQTKCELYPGCPHAHWGFFPGIEVTTRAVADVMVGVGWLLGEDLTREQAMQRGM